MGILELENLCYSYDEGKIPVFNNLSLSFEEGKTYAIVGKEGTGKTTLLSLIAGLDKAAEGKILYNNIDISKIDTYKYRCRDIGVIFQNYGLLTNLSAVENVILSMEIAEMKIKDKKNYALDLLKSVGISEEKSNQRVIELSLGDQLRTAIARAICYEPHLIIADEPTEKLDQETEKEIYRIFHNLAAEKNKCVIIATLSSDVPKEIDVIYKLIALQEDDFIKDKYVRFYKFD